MTAQIQLTDPQIRYLQYLVAHKVEKDEPIFLTQNKAGHRFGRNNVQRWFENGKIKAHYRGIDKNGIPTTIEFKMAELLEAAETYQDYIIK